MCPLAVAITNHFKTQGHNHLYSAQDSQDWLLGLGSAWTLSCVCQVLMSSWEWLCWSWLNMSLHSNLVRMTNLLSLGSPEQFLNSWWRSLRTETIKVSLFQARLNQNALHCVLLTEICQKAVSFKEEVEGGSRPNGFSKECFWGMGIFVTSLGRRSVPGTLLFKFVVM